MNLSDKIAQYRIEQLQAEVNFVVGDPNRLAWRIYRNPVFRFLTYHLQNFYWTLTRLLGLAHWHDGTRQVGDRHDMSAASKRGSDGMARSSPLGQY